MPPRLARLARAAALALLLPVAPHLLAESTISDDPSTWSDCCSNYYLSCGNMCWGNGGTVTASHCQDLSPTTCTGWIECTGVRLSPYRCTF